MIVARGSTEAVGLGRIGVVAGNVSHLVPGSSVSPVVYPATFDAYFVSEGTGVIAMTTMIKAYTDACPDSKIALIGYSQGGQVAMDVVCGTSETLFKVTPDLGSAFEKNGELQPNGRDRMKSNLDCSKIRILTSIFQLSPS
jgi:hypothetical protein